MARNLTIEEKVMNRIMPCTGAHPSWGEEVMTMDDVEVDVRCESVGNITSDNRERMGK